MSLTRTLSLLLVSLIAFSVVVYGVARLTPHPQDPELAAKLAFFERHKADYDLLFFGSSRVLRGVIPLNFDRRMKSLGHPLRSYSFALEGMKPHEVSALLRLVLEMDPPSVRWIVVELGHWTPELEAKNRLASRVTAWHDLPETRSVIRSVLLKDTPVSEKARLILDHLRHMGIHFLRVGRGHQAARALFAGDPAPAIPSWISRHAGYQPVPAHRQESRHRRKFLADLPVYLAEVKGLSRTIRIGGSLESYNVWAIDQQVALIRQSGAEPIHLITPTFGGSAALFRLHDEGHVPVLLNFNNPGDYPVLFEIQNRFDRNHLSANGARLFTLKLAERFAAHLGTR